MAFRPFLLAAALLPSIVACGGDEEGNVIPEGEHYHYVANRVLVPTTNTQAREYGLDLNKDKTIDNQLGMVLSTLGSMGFDIQAAIDQAVATGDILLLMDFQTKSFTSTTKAGVKVLLGDSDTIMPAACNAGEMYDEVMNKGCGHHLEPGVGVFTVASMPQEVALGGKIVNGTFTGGPGNLSLQIALAGTALQLDLIGARAKGSSLSETMLGSGTSGGIVFGGAISKSDIDGKVIPEIQKQLVELISRDCPMANPASNTCYGGTNAGMTCTGNAQCPGTGAACTPCGCKPDSTGKTVLGLFDTKKADGSEGKDCAVSEDEIKTNSLIVSLLAPDVKIDGIEALSIGIKATGVNASF